METKIILIARVSDKEQRKALPAQKLRLEKYAEQKKLPYEYHEFDESAHKEERTKFAELVVHIKKQTGLCYVVFDKIDRLTRDSSQEEVKLLQQLVKQGKIELHFPHDSLYIDQDSSAADWFRLGIGMALAKYYSDSIRDNVKRRFEQMLSEGIWVHRAPIGYKNVNTGTVQKPIKSIEVDEEKAPFIAKAFELRATGMPYEVIAKQLGKEGFCSNIAGSKAPNKAFLERILSNKFYYGVMVHGGREYDHHYPTIITRGLFNQCQRVRDQRTHEKTKYDSKDYTFKKIVKCGVCGRAVSPFKARNTVYLRCASGGKCGNPNTAESLVIDGVVSEIGNVDIPEHLIEKVIDELRKRHNNQQQYYTQSIEQTRSEYDKIKEKMRKVYYDRLEGRITQPFRDEIANELELKQQELNDRLKMLTSDNKSFQLTASYLLDLAQRADQLFKESDESLQQKLLEYLLSNIELNDKKLSYVLNDPFRQIVESKKKGPNDPDSTIWCG